MVKTKERQKVKTTVLHGAVRLRTKMSPTYLNQLSQEAYSLFDAPGAGEMVAKVFTGQIKKGQGFIPRAFSDQAQKLMAKYALTGGTATDYLSGKLAFKSDGTQPILNDIIAEITIKDGIVEKIEKVRFPEPL